ncbi:MAG: adenylate/guanylate cyclase domain-containing protein, partial [Elusimicrobia bacterium CG_4_8_14_3_um_filter_50_9]
HLPEEVIKTLNEYFAMMIDVIFRNEGTLDKFIGDCIMVIFGAPLQMSDHPLRAVKTAIEMQSALEDFNQRRTSEGKEPISIGIGINSGEAIVGNVGSEKKVEFTVVGDSVNIASRLESNSKKGQILIGKNTYKRVKDYITAKKLGCIEMKGKTNQIEIYEVKGFTAGGGK